MSTAMGFNEQVKERFSLVNTVNTIIALAEKELKAHTGIDYTLIAQAAKPPTAPAYIEVRDIICKALGYLPAEIIARNQTKVIVSVRHIVISIVHQYYPSVSLIALAECVGLTHHKTVLDSLKRSKELLKSDDLFQQQYDIAIQAITQVMAKDDKRFEDKRKFKIRP